MNRITIKGEIYKVGEVKEFGANQFRKHEVVIRNGSEEYPNFIPIEFTKEMIDESTRLEVGHDVSIECRVKGREWEKNGEFKYFISMQGLEVNSPAETGDAPMPI